MENAIAFARYEKGDFGWGVVVPGYNFTVASTSRPADAAAAAALATRGVFAPLVPSDDADEAPAKLEEYFLSVQPGYEDDPSQAVYNRAWILGRRQGRSPSPAGSARPADRAHPGPVERAVDCGARERVRATRPERARAHRRGRAPADGRVHAALRAAAPQPDPDAHRPAPGDHPARIEGEREIRRLDETRWAPSAGARSSITNTDFPATAVRGKLGTWPGSSASWLWRTSPQARMS